VDFWETVKKRRSVRSFDKERDVSPETVARLLEAAIRAPSAGNCQPWYFLAVRDQEIKRGLARAALDQWFLSDAPVVIVVCADPERSASRYGQRGRLLYCLQDTAAAAEHILLGAVALGLGGCWIGAFDEEEASRVLHLPPHLRPVAILSIGYPKGRAPGPTDRRRLKDVSQTIT
jgi:nitroreductase